MKLNISIVVDTRINNKMLIRYDQLNAQVNLRHLRFRDSIKMLLVIRWTLKEPSSALFKEYDKTVDVQPCMNRAVRNGQKFVGR